MSGNKIKKLRVSKGLSQADLANLTALSIRTIQRIENNNTEPRGDSLLKLAAALNIAPRELTVSEISTDQHDLQDNQTYLVLLNLSALTFIFFPLLAVFAPFVLWHLKKDIKGIDAVAKPLINFQISFLLLGLVVLSGAIANQELHWRLKLPYELGGYSFFELLLFGVPALNVLYIVTNSILIATKRPVLYKPAIKFIKS
ncbi:helix-turn-helix domain-containing protein [Mucilaginibacter auburnensis]|uniref:Transcriptional regulator with XRE-family HTH domain n=1 Tax=Mucilaginibacter auburnensis TaxID=1457233 RepID=A0A2H9VNP6_9SPHI|nr:helix-turn-helix domain-containing protein [Mucilaginibacter auburnensis]PJJ79930.1 transcriptional regulator with XRE-family HTH domain [Mucilaginibacter auburnensis]